MPSCMLRSSFARQNKSSPTPNELRNIPGGRQGAFGNRGEGSHLRQTRSRICLSSGSGTLIINVSHSSSYRQRQNAGGRTFLHKLLLSLRFFDANDNVHSRRCVFCVLSTGTNKYVGGERKEGHENDQVLIPGSHLRPQRESTFQNGLSSNRSVDSRARHTHAPHSPGYHSPLLHHCQALLPA